ncbi:amino acid adenylation domain-containing protein [Micromonospora sp. M71_S20]|uniref:non-ribosomal peptide synthetase n=1 Tax=Micromonospora sp. M71_S20 TaxID=592872 RepID=UPI000EB04150|nr:non-ribosomal peptide synthetase [Micromonospora sp. M71_S20]RLK09769.1 amino acid adenylation domain-containing protein [Micromonospora sp. M71_S20]
MALIDLLSELAGLGMRLSAQGDKLRITGPRERLTEPLRARLAAHRDEVLQFVREQEHEERRRSVRIVPVDRTRPLPASYAQRRLWLIEQLATDVPIYNMYMARTITGPLDTDAMRLAVETITARHEILRSALVEDGDDLFQVPDPAGRPAYTEHDLREAADETVRQLLYDIVATRFDLSRAPLIRFDLIRTGATDWILVITQHHVISDGWSAGIIRKEISELYSAAVEGREPDLPDLPVQYADFAAWERQWITGEVAAQQREFWRGQLAQLPAALELMPGRPRAAVQSYRGDALVFTYDAELMKRLRELCAECGTTLYGALVAAYGLLLSRMTRADDLAIGSPLASRPYPVLENTLGLFFNSITVRMRPDPQQTVREYLAAVRRSVFDAFAHQDLPFDQVVQAVAPDRSVSHSPLFQAIFILQSYPETGLSLTGLETGQAVAPVYATQYDIMFKLREDGDLGTGFLVYNSEMFAKSDMSRLVDWFARVVRLMAADPDASLGDLVLAGAEDLAHVARWNAATARELPALPVHRQILAQLHADPTAPAVTFRGHTLTSAALAERAQAITAGLVAAGLRPGDRVGVLVPRSTDLVATLLGVLSAGMAYVPLDGAAPQPRSAASLAIAECAALIVEHPAVPSPPFDGRVLPLTELTGHPPLSTLPEVPADSTAYVIFTSGSTGVPKGVRIAQRNLTNFFAAMDETVPLPPRPVWLAVTNVTFDIAVLELLWTLSRGVHVVLGESMETLHRLAEADTEPVKVPDLIETAGVNALQATPTFVRTVLRMPGGPRALARLHTLLVGGEPLDPALATTLRELGIPRVLNMYGPTETTVWSTAWQLDSGPPLVGRPVANTTVHIVDAFLRPVPVGMFGELVIGGAGVSQGYVGDPELTARRFVSAPHLDDGATVYRTGDLARMTPDGTIELVGRFDNQVKLNGHRIELEEIERAVAALPGLQDCAVVVQTDGDQSRLAAHCVTADGAAVDEEWLRVELARTLPPQMIPGLVATIPALPVSPNGKLDRKALPRIEARAVGSEPVTADGDLEEALLAAWRRVLGDERIGVTDDFFRSGGNSLLVVRLLSEVRAQAAPQARIVDLFRFPTVRNFAAHLAGGAADEPGVAADHDEAQRARLRRQQQVRRKRQARTGG